MRQSRFTEDQIIGVLREHEAGVKPADRYRKHGISDPVGDKKPTSVDSKTYPWLHFAASTAFNSPASSRMSDAERRRAIPIGCGAGPGLLVKNSRISAAASGRRARSDKAEAIVGKRNFSSAMSQIAQLLVALFIMDRDPLAILRRSTSSEAEGGARSAFKFHRGMLRVAAETVRY